LDVREILRRLQVGEGDREVSRDLHVSRKTVAKYRLWAQGQGLLRGRFPIRVGFQALLLTSFRPAPPPRMVSSMEPYRDRVLQLRREKVECQAILARLHEEKGFTGSYKSVWRFVRALEPQVPEAVVRVETPPGQEGQVDFFQGAPTFDSTTGQWRRPWEFRMTLACSRHGYEESVWDQKLESFLKLHENAFQDFGGVPTVVRHDNLKAGIVRACLYDPDANTVYMAFAKHWGFTPLPIRPANPRENGKQERAGGYVKSNALKARRFESLEEKNAFLRHWNRTVARLRIHGTTRRQVWSHFLEVEKPALQSLPAEPFALFESGTRSVHPDGHVEVAGSFYPVPHHLLGQTVGVRWDRHLVRVFHGEIQVAVHVRVAPGLFAPRPGQKPEDMVSSQRGFLERLLLRCERVGPELRLWGEAAYQERGVRAFRLLQGVIQLTRTHTREHVLHAARLATEHRLFRYKDLQRLASLAQGTPRQPRLIDDHPAIRPMTAYRMEDFL
jgi:transposase